jgi:hypothetical protein
MPSFTQELSCTDSSTDASIFSPSVHPTLHTCHIRRRLPLIDSNPNYPRRAARAVLARTPPTSDFGQPPAYECVPTLSADPPPPPPAAVPHHRVQSRARAGSHRDLGSRCHRQFRPSAAVPTRRRPSPSAQDSQASPQPLLLDHSSCGEHKPNFPLHCIVPRVNFLCSSQLSTNSC